MVLFELRSEPGHLRPAPRTIWITPLRRWMWARSALARMLEFGARKRRRAVFLVSSTSECYGDPLVHPQGLKTLLGQCGIPWDRGLAMTRANASVKHSPWAYHRKTRSPGLTSRGIFNTYGPRMKAQRWTCWFQLFLDRALRDEPITGLR